jgi:hypothetical protein
MNIELERIWPDLGIDLLFGHFDILGSYCSLQLQAVSIRRTATENNKQWGWFTASVFGFCSRTGMQ